MTRQVPSSKSARKDQLAASRFAVMAAEYLLRMGERMAQRRKELGLTQEQVARALPGETSGTHLSRWERGLHRPSDDTLEALAKVLKVDVAYFLAAQADKSNGTPDPFAAERSQLERIEHNQAAILRDLARILQALRLNPPDEPGEEGWVPVPGPPGPIAPTGQPTRQSPLPPGSQDPARRRGSA